MPWDSSYFFLLVSLPGLKKMKLSCASQLAMNKKNSFCGWHYSSDKYFVIFFTVVLISYYFFTSSGPRRVNHASVSIGEYIYSFGGYCSFENYRVSRPIDIHVLNTNTLRWSLLPLKKDQKYPQVPFQRYGELIT